MFAFIHFFGLSSAFLAFLFLINNFLIFVVDAPGVINLLGLNDLLGTEAPKDGYSAGLFALGILQVSAAVGAIVFAAWRVMKSIACVKTL